MILFPLFFSLIIYGLECWTYRSACQQQKCGLTIRKRSADNVISNLTLKYLYINTLLCAQSNSILNILIPWHIARRGSGYPVDDLSPQDGKLFHINILSNIWWCGIIYIRTKINKSLKKMLILFFPKSLI